MLLENNRILVEVSKVGSQITRIYDKDKKIEYIWNGKEWPKHAPLLFPAIGASFNNSYFIKGKKYFMPIHGFANISNFEVISESDNNISLKLSESEKTKEFYPFNFNLIVSFTLLSSKIAISYFIQNLSKTIMPFSLGVHPAFNIPIKKDDGNFNNYSIAFSGQFSLPLKTYEIIQTPIPFRTGNIVKFSDEKVINLNHNMFRNGLKIIKNSNIYKVTLASPEKSFLSIDVGDFKNVCLWTKEDKNLDFLCVELFNGLPDANGKSIDWMNKKGNLFLKPSQSKLFQYNINIEE